MFGYMVSEHGLKRKRPEDRREQKEAGGGGSREQGDRVGIGRSHERRGKWRKRSKGGDFLGLYN